MDNPEYLAFLVSPKRKKNEVVVVKGIMSFISGQLAIPG
jgi:hypothetical protein